MKTLFLLFAILVSSVAVRAQDLRGPDLTVLPCDYWWGSWVDLNAMSTHDTISVGLPIREQVLFATPRTLRAGDVDSIGVWCELPYGTRLQVGTAWDQNNFRVIDSEAIVGPKPYGLYFVPYHVPESGFMPVANYIVTIVNAGAPSIDAVCLATHGQLEVKEKGAPTITRIQRWYNELGIPDSLHGVIRH